MLQQPILHRGGEQTELCGHLHRQDLVQSRMSLQPQFVFPSPFIIHTLLTPMKTTNNHRFSIRGIQPLIRQVQLRAQHHSMPGRDSLPLRQQPELLRQEPRHQRSPLQLHQRCRHAHRRSSANQLLRSRRLHFSDLNSESVCPSFRALTLYRATHSRLTYPCSDIFRPWLVCHRLFQHQQSQR